MAEFTQLKGAQRPFRQVQTPSGSEGTEALSSVFGKIAQKSFEKVIEINNEKSNASLYNATNQIYRMKHIIQSDFLKNPDQVIPLMEGAISDVKNIVQQTPMNDSDRKRLEYLANNDITDIEAQGLKIKSDHARTQGMIAFGSQWPEKLQQIQDSWNKGEKELDYQYENSQKILTDALTNGFLTSHQYESYLDTLHETVNVAKEAHDLYQDEEKHTAKEFHKANTRFDQRNTFGQVGAPSDESSNFLYSHEINQRNFSDVKAALYNDRPPDPLRFMNLSKAEREEVKMIRDVVRDVKARFNSGASWDEMESVHQSLDSKKDYVLSTEERAAKAYLDNFFERFTPDKYLNMMSTTPLGASATYEHNMQINSVQTNESYSPEQKEAFLRDFDNQYADKMVSVGIAKNIPNDKIMPIASPVIQRAQSSFGEGGDPMQLLQTIDHYNSRNRIYVSQAMKTPEQKEIAYTVGILEGKTSNAKRQELIAANQEKIDWSPLQLGKEGIAESLVKADVYADPNIEKINTYNSHFRSKPGEERSGALVNATVNAVRYASLRRGELDLKNYRKDIEEWGKEYAKGYDIYSSSDFAFNRKQQPQVSDYEWASVAQYAKAQAYEAMRKRNPGASNVDFRQTQDVNPLYVVITPDNLIVAQDQYGNPAFSQPLSQALVAHSVVENNRIEQETAIDRRKVFRGSEILKGMVTHAR